MDKNLKETKELNAQARANSTPSGQSKVSFTSGSSGSSFTSSAQNFDLEEAKKLNQKSRNASPAGNFSNVQDPNLEEARKLNQESRAKKGLQ